MQDRPRTRAARLLRRGSIAVMLLSLCHAGASRAYAQSADSLLTLDQVLSRAAVASPALARAEGGVRTASAAQRSAFAAFFPTLALESNSLRATTPSPVSQPGLSGSADGSSAFGLTSSLDLFTAGRRGAERKRAAANASLSASTLVEQQYAVRVQAKRAFFDVLRTSELLRVTKARVDRANDAIAAARARRVAGTATRSDELRAELELTDAEQAQLQAEAAHDVSRYALARVVGLDHPVGARADSTIVRPLGISDQDFVALVMQNAPTVQSAQAGVRVAQAGVSVARARYLPTLQLSGGYRWVDARGGSFFDDGPLWNLRLGLNFPLFDGFVREEQVTRARVQADIADADVRDRQRGVRTDAQRALANLHVAERRIALAERAVAAAREDLRVQEARYRAGATTILERMTSLINLATAETTLVTVRYDYQIARAELEALAGREL